jgi:hypothetical protein
MKQQQTLRVKSEPMVEVICPCPGNQALIDPLMFLLTRTFYLHTCRECGREYRLLFDVRALAQVLPERSLLGEQEPD